MSQVSVVRVEGTRRSWILVPPLPGWPYTSSLSWPARETGNGKPFLKFPARKNCSDLFRKNIPEQVTHNWLKHRLKKKDWSDDEYLFWYVTNKWRDHNFKSSEILLKGKLSQKLRSWNNICTKSEQFQEKWQNQFSL